MANEYVSIRVSTLRGDQKIDFNAFIKINDKHVLYLRRGDSFEGDRLKRLKEKKLRQMYIIIDDEDKYRSYLKVNIEQAYDNGSGKDISTRAEIIQGAQQSNTEEVFENPENAETYNNAKDAAGRFVDFLMTNTPAVQHILNSSNTDQNLAHHGVSVATLSVSLANRLGINDPKQTQLLTLGALLHDFGHMEGNTHYNKPKKSLTPQELKEYLMHPKLGAQRVQDKKHFDQSVINIIMQHEETIDGRGPNKLNENQTDPNAVIVSSANALDRLIAFEGVAKEDAAKQLMINAVGEHPLKHLQILADIMKGK